jgi:transcriptional regulator with XRE-family HTH domain
MGNLSKLVKEYRAKRKFSLRELGERTGLHYSYIGKIESGKTKQPSRDTVRRLAFELEAPVDDFEMAAGYMPLDYQKTSHENRKKDYVGREKSNSYMDNRMDRKDDWSNSKDSWNKDDGNMGVAKDSNDIGEKHERDGYCGDHDSGRSDSGLSPEAKKAIKTLYDELFGADLHLS